MIVNNFRTTYNVKTTFLHVIPFTYRYNLKAKRMEAETGLAYG